MELDRNKQKLQFCENIEEAPAIQNSDIANSDLAEHGQTCQVLTIRNN